MKTKSNRTNKEFSKIEIKNFGPIKNGKIEIKPLTIFIGSNNSGKSYLAMLIHSILETISMQFEKSINNRYRRNRYNISRVRELYVLCKQNKSEWAEVYRRFKNKDNKEPILLSNDFINNILEKLFSLIIESLKKEIKRLYGTDITNLVLIGKSCFNINLSTNYLKLKISTKRKIDLKFTIEHTNNIIFYLNSVSEKNYDSEFKYNKRKNRVDVFIDPIFSDDVDEFMLSFVRIIDNDFLKIILNSFNYQSYYLPAARSGILQAHKALVASIIEKSSYAVIDKVEIPKLSGVISDFISTVINIDDFNRTDLVKLSQDFETELIDGSIVLDRTLNSMYPEIIYKSKNLRIPLYRSSSTISELAPLILYIRHRITKNSFLIIEEPEAHLHPAKQKILAKYIARLVRNKVNIVLTTHSDYLLTQLNTFIKLSNIEENLREEKYKYQKNDFIKANEISVYVFEKDKSKIGYNIKPVCINEIDGIEEEEFSKVYETLYDESLKLNLDLQKFLK